MRIDYKNPIVKMCCRCLSIRDLKKVLKLPSRDSTLKCCKNPVILKRSSTSTTSSSSFSEVPMLNRYFRILQVSL